MSVEIKEMIIRAVVTDKNEVGDDDKAKEEQEFLGGLTDNEKIISEAMENTLAVIDLRRER